MGLGSRVWGEVSRAIILPPFRDTSKVRLSLGLKLRGTFPNIQILELEYVPMTRFTSLV